MTDADGPRVTVTRYRAGGNRLLAVDAEQYVPDRAAFATRLCDGETGVAPDGGEPAVGVETDGRAAPADGTGQPAVTGGSDTGQPAAADRSSGSVAGASGDVHGADVHGADAVCFLALEPEYRPPRVVLTVVRPDGERTPFCPHAARCAARWAADRTGADRVMVDTQAGTRAARIHDDDSVGIEARDPTTGDAAEESPDDPVMERDDVVAEFTVEVAITR